MMILITGTPGSGKSLLAETISSELAEGRQKVYIATMIPYGEEGMKRVEKHRRMREGKGFVTIEKPHTLKEIIPDIRGMDCLLECMSNLTGNEMYLQNRQHTDDELPSYIAGCVGALAQEARSLTVVTNVFDDDGPGWDDETRRYSAMVRRVNLLLKQEADRVYELRNGEWIVVENT